MEDINNSYRDAAPVIGNFNINNIPRCPKCNLICSLILDEKKKNVVYSCERGHKGYILLKNYLNEYNKNSLSKEKCKNCFKNKNEIKGDFIYCSDCQNFLCYLCLINHDENHRSININRYDSLCKIHSNLFSFYCNDCNKNICAFCKVEHKNHKLTDLIEFNFNEENKNKFKKEKEKLIELINKLDDLINYLNLKINELKDYIQINRFYLILFSTYEYEEKQKNLNYYVIRNLKNYKEKDINSFDSILKELNEYILNFNSSKKNNFSNNFTDNFKTIHGSSVYYLEKLNDGRLASYSEDHKFKIYSEDSFNENLSIYENSTFIIKSICQLKDGRIALSSGSKNMSIIKLQERNKYIIDQALEGHNEATIKIIEIRKNELISISFDTNMRIWKLNNENKFECIKVIKFSNIKTWGNILKINESEFVTSSCTEKCLKFWNSNNYSNISKINNIETSFYSRQNMNLIKDDILCVGGDNSKGFYLIKISTHQIIKNIIGPKVIYSVSKCLDGLILCSIIDEKGNNSLVKYKYEEDNLKKIVEKVNAHNKDIYCSIELNNGIIASGGNDGNIKLWK